ncbi:MAG: HEPN domain-containing protein [Oscillospiraceae bacterium]|nr:HEPN domain-containing protein [Oscillospiraceae bacterium]
MSGNYYDIARNDLFFAKVGIEANLEKGIDGYNNCATSCSQAAEKFLKHLFVIFDLTFERELSETHNLNALVRELLKSFPEIEVLQKQCRFLTNYYFEDRYPGDNFKWVDYDTVKLCYQYANDIKEVVDSIINNPNYGQKLNEALRKKFTK